MKRLLPIICAAAIALTATGATLAPASAASSFGFQFGTSDDNSDNNNHRGFERRGNDGYYNGHRGSRTQQPGYRQINGYWFPALAFGAIAGAIIANSVNDNNNGGNYDGEALPGDHVAYCENRYRSYRVSDNSFQPYNGPRQVCVSPYWN
jgi:hypothetical protein